jgi:hypothetical protein
MPARQAPLPSFSRIADPNKRSAAYFTELSKVLTSPRCLNCHPAGDRPRQGDSSRLHQPPVYRGREWTRPGIRALSHVSSKQQLRSRPGSGACEVAARADRDGMGRQNGFRDLSANQRSGEKRQTLLERPRRACRRRHAGRMGMEPAIRQNARTRNAEAGGRTRSSMGEIGRHLPLIRHLLSSVCELLQPAGDTAFPQKVTASGTVNRQLTGRSSISPAGVGRSAKQTRNIALQSAIADWTQLRKTFTLSSGQRPSHGIVPFSNLLRIAGACRRTSFTDHRSKTKLIDSRSIFLKNGLMC